LRRIQKKRCVTGCYPLLGTLTLRWDDVEFESTLVDRRVVSLDVSIACVASKKPKHFEFVSLKHAAADDYALNATRG
jgi:hypothetical protein